jgi:protein-tyrosine phosphatase
MAEDNARYLLFLCTANLYRSRFAEGLFNHGAIRRGLGWRAFSRGILAEERESGLSPHARNGFLLAGVDPGLTSPGPRRLTRQCLQAADRIIALQESEHRAFLEEHFPEEEGRIAYWNVPDIDVLSPPQALIAIQDGIEAEWRRLADPAGRTGS